MVQGGSRSMARRRPGDSGRARGFQLWLALPPEQELGPMENVYLAPDAVARNGPARVLVGAHGGVASTLQFPTSLNYLVLRLSAGQSWRYQPPIDHAVGWVAVSKGRASCPRHPGRGRAGDLRAVERRDRFPCGLRHGVRPRVGRSARPRPRAGTPFGAYQRRDAAGRRTAAQRDPRRLQDEGRL